MKRVLMFFFSVYGVLTFLSINVLMIIGYIIVKIVLPYRRQIDGVYAVNRAGIFLWSAICGIRYQITGKENVDPKQSYIVASNHVNTFDIQGVAYGCRVIAKPLYKKELERVPVLGQLFKLSSIGVDRSSEASRKKSLQKMLSELRMGISIHMFPEGTRNRSDMPLQKFHHGAFTLAIETQTPIMPLVLTGLREMNKPNSLLFQPGRIGVHHLPPVFPETTNKEDWQSLADKVYAEMEKTLLALDPHFNSGHRS
jgi:1-acyl-sn-glycerol-3-phosphate acyltransferase